MKEVPLNYLIGTLEITIQNDKVKLSKVIVGHNTSSRKMFATEFKKRDLFQHVSVRLKNVSKEISKWEEE